MHPPVLFYAYYYPKIIPFDSLTHLDTLSFFPPVALNFQTPGQFMDVYEGRFRANGGCGYLLKPAVMREHISVFSAHSRETIPGVAPQLLKIKVNGEIGRSCRVRQKGGKGGDREGMEEL